MAKHTGSALKELQRLSLDKPNQQVAQAARTAPPAAQAERLCKKVSVSLGATDRERVTAIRTYMAQRGEMISFSQAIKLALRCAPLSDDLLTMLDQVKAEDGRGKWE